ncbi:MAG: DNA adenine methylase [Planctomycetota bacterium]
MKSPIAYFGGKSRLAAKFIPLFPEHKRYVEVFGGGGSILFAKPLSDLEIYNDLDSALFEFFSVLADPKLFAKLKRTVEAMPFSRQLHVHCFRTWSKEKTIVGRVAKWYVAMRQGFSGKLSESWGYSVASGHGGKTQCVSKWINGIAGLPQVHGRVRTVQIDHRDFRRVIAAYDKPDTFFYFDPPYDPSTRKSGKYRCEMTVEDHHELVDRLLNLEGKAMLSGYDTELYRPLEKRGWRRREFPVTCSAAGRVRGSGLQGKGRVKEKQQRVEVIWANYDLPG